MEWGRRDRWDPGCVGMPGDAWGCLGMPGDAWGCLGMPGDAWGCLGMPGAAWGCLGLHFRKSSVTLQLLVMFVQKNSGLREACGLAAWTCLLGIAYR
jgi:hypothetical protein